MNNIRLTESIVELTHACPMACKHCYVKKNKPDLSLEEWLYIFSKLKEIGIRDIVLMGGESTVYPYFTQIISYCLNTFKNVTVETSATTKTEFYRFPSCNVCVSFEYPEKERNDNIRIFKNGKKSHFETAIRKIKTLHNPKILRFTLYQDSNVFKSLVMADMYGCNSIFFPLIPLGSGKGMIRNCPDAKKIAETLRTIEEFNKKSRFHHELALPQTYLYNKELYLKFAKTFKERSRVCQAGFRRIYIDVSGNVMPCPFIPIKLGNLLKNDINFIYSKIHEFNEKMEKKMPGFPCSECFYYKLCGAGCHAYHYNKKTKQQENCPVNFLIKNYKEVIRK